MSYRCLFEDNEEYSAADVNGVLSSFVTEGIEDPFTDGTAYHVDKVNEITVALSNPGIVPETDTSCKCVINAEAKTVRICAGTVFLANGSRIIFDTEGETLSYTAGAENYVYVIADESENRSYPLCSVTEPSKSADFVMLAYISAEEELIDKRRYAKGKLPGYQSNAGLPMYVDDTLNVYHQEGYPIRKGYNGTYTIHLGANNVYSAVIYDRDYETTGIYNDKIHFGYYDIKNNLYRSVSDALSTSNIHFYTESIVVYVGTYTQAELTFEKSGTDLIVNVSVLTNDSNPKEYYAVPIKLKIY